MLEKILFNEIPVRNMERSISWYKEVLGLQLVWYSKEEGLAQLNLPSGQMIFLNETSDEGTNANFMKNGREHNVIAFQASDIEKLYEHLKVHHVYVEDIIDDGLGNLFLHFHDLWGNRFCVQQDVNLA
ncbi:VOC family protein [Robertmurraya sp. DFI.2.37]|jgi:catechol 2,3-dioxygenase-like lactoylglutathione lyase family enzyme|uniref:VOC family protein n=1 Tax=Robertmurraya sp. DFI.2.37 TaxID=3031819 RepID=UPI0012464E29|nr:VOC family protein [Robertmurraya sp. DFI.2.37]MDF1509421.1 VOC family protein [Robertmurraya sp. DFI.2.37]